MEEMNFNTGFNYPLKPRELVAIARDIAQTGNFGVTEDTLIVIAHKFLKEGIPKRELETAYVHFSNSQEFLNGIYNQAQMFL